MNNTVNLNDQLHIHENRAYGIVSESASRVACSASKTDNAYIEYDENSRKEEDNSWWYICLACFMCR